MKITLSAFLLFTSIALFAQQKWSLQQCIDYAIEHNLQIKSNELNRDIQEKNKEIAQKEKLPSVSGNFSNNLSFGQQRYVNLVQRNDNFNNSANVSADILVYNNGRLEKSIRRNQLELQASMLDVESTRDDILVQIASQYLTVLLNKEIVQINKSALENAQRLYDRAKITTEVGTTAQTVLAEAESGLAREKQNVISSEINVKRSLFSLAQLLQLQEYKDFDIVNVEISETLSSPIYTADQIIATAYSQRPEIKAAQYRIQAAKEQTEITKTAFYPTISASAGIGTFYFNQLNQGNDTGFFKQYSDNFGQQLGLSANIPIFSKGITKLQVEQSKINELVSENNLELQKQQVLQNVQQAQFDAESNYEVYQAAIQAEKSSALALDFAEKSYEGGRATIYDLTNARNNHANAMGSMAQAKYNYVFSLKLLNFYAGVPITLN